MSSRLITLTRILVDAFDREYIITLTGILVDAFDREYKLAFRRLPLTDRQYLHVTDFPPTPTVIWCRKLFGMLQVA